MRTLHLTLATLLATCTAAWPWQQIPFSWGRGSSSPSPPIQDTGNAHVFSPRRQTLRLENILVHGAPHSKHSKVFRRLAVDDETRQQMAQINALNAESSSPGSSFEHPITDAFFSLYDDEGDDADEKGRKEGAQLFPLPWKRVPDAKDQATVVSMVRMALDCYVDPKRQGWVDIGDPWDVETEIGWLEAGLRGYVFSSEDKKTVVIGIKGTSLKLFGTGGGPTGTNDKINDNKMFSCCCGKVDRTWWPVCSCATGGNQCNQQCLVNDLITDRDEGDSYYGIALRVLDAAKQLYPDASIWLTGHSLGGSVASTVGITKGYPVFTFQSPGDARFAQRIGIVKSGNLTASELKRMPVWQFGHTGMSKGPERR
ncbi:putative lipase atg15 [Gamsiella multidivaricata]|nr:putative lipase atg15 [Gamsiella multidivaricata]